MAESYDPAWWLPGPHSMTLWGKFFRRRPQVAVRTERWKTPDDDEVSVVRLDADPASPRLLVLHGLEGSANSHYVTGLLAGALSSGWGADVLIFRTCDGRMNLARRTYHSGETGDLHFVSERILDEFPAADLAVAGVSLGANVLLKWLGERGTGVSGRLRAAAAVSTPFDLARSSAHISQGSSRLYERNFLRSLRRKALAKLEHFPDIGSPAAVQSSRTLRQFDDAFTAPAHGFRDADDYYDSSSSIRWLGSIRVPTLLLSARDDPFHPPEVLEEVERIARMNPYLNAEFPERGGHVGFVEGRWPHRPRYYIDRRIGEFFALHFSGGAGSALSERLPVRGWELRSETHSPVSQWK